MTVSGPTIVRRQLARRLRQIRRDQGKTVEAVVSTGAIAKGTLHRYESGRFPMTPGTVLALCFLYRLDTKTTEELHGLAVGSLEQGWWESKEEVLKTGLGFYIGMESAASVIKVYDPSLVPGVLQTAEYARTVTQADIPTPDEQTTEARVAFRLKRQQTLMERTPTLQFHFVLGPAVLPTEVGDPEVMAEQIAHIRKLAQTQQVDVRVLSTASGAPPRWPVDSP